MLLNQYVCQLVAVVISKKCQRNAVDDITTEFQFSQKQPKNVRNKDVGLLQVRYLLYSILFLTGNCVCIISSCKRHPQNVEIACFNRASSIDRSSVFSCKMLKFVLYEIENGLFPKTPEYVKSFLSSLFFPFSERRPYACMQGH